MFRFFWRTIAVFFFRIFHYFGLTEEGIDYVDFSFGSQYQILWLLKIGGFLVDGHYFNVRDLINFESDHGLPF